MNLKKKKGQGSAVVGLKTAVGGPGWTIELSTQLYVIICDVHVSVYVLVFTLICWVSFPLIRVHSHHLIVFGVLQPPLSLPLFYAFLVDSFHALFSSVLIS